MESTLGRLAIPCLFDRLFQGFADRMHCLICLSLISSPSYSGVRLQRWVYSSDFGQYCRERLSLTDRCLKSLESSVVISKLVSMTD